MAVREVSFHPAYLQLTKLGVGLEDAGIYSDSFVGPHPDSPFKAFVSASPSDLVPQPGEVRIHLGRKSPYSRRNTTALHSNMVLYPMSPMVLKMPVWLGRRMVSLINSLAPLAIFSSLDYALAVRTFYPQTV